LLVLDALSEIDSKLFSNKLKGVTKEIHDLMDERAVNQQRLKDLQDQIAKPERRSVLDMILDSIGTIKDRNKDIETRLNILDGLEDETEELLIEGLATLSERFGGNSLNDKETRKKLRDIIQRVVTRIEILPFKESNNTTTALLCIGLTDGTKRICFLNPIDLPNSNRVVLYDGSNKPIITMNRYGLVLYSFYHKGRTAPKTFYLVSDGKRVPDKNIDGVLQIRNQIFNHMRSKECRKWQLIDVNTIYGYSDHADDF
jgi:hypothetical protein